MSAFDELLLLMATDNNHEMSRNVLQREGTAKHSDATLSEERQKGGAKSRTCPSLSMFGVVPYLGTFLQDLTFIDSAHPNSIKGDLINFDKRRKVCVVCVARVHVCVCVSVWMWSCSHMYMHSGVPLPVAVL